MSWRRRRRRKRRNRRGGSEESVCEGSEEDRPYATITLLTRSQHRGGSFGMGGWESSLPNSGASDVPETQAGERLSGRLNQQAMVFGGLMQLAARKGNISR